MTTKTNTYLASKPRYEILDGLRGVASVIVVLFHALETYSGGAAYQIINHGYLAVDFFFVLSGFVVGYAYDDRWDKMTVWGFFKRRLVRLHPMVVMGTVIGLCFFYFGQNDGFPLIRVSEWWKVLLVFVMGCLMIPCWPRMDIRGWGETNPLNGPNWSLTWEYVANILYALVFRRLPNILLMLLVAAAGFCTLDLCLNMNVFGLLTDGRSSLAYTPIGGWSLTPEQIYIGLTRLFYPFLCGLLMSRIGKFIKVRGRLLVVFPSAVHRSGHTLCRRPGQHSERFLQCILHSHHIPRDSFHRCRKRNQRRKEFPYLQFPRRTFIPSVHHALSSHVRADELGLVSP